MGRSTPAAAGRARARLSVRVYSILMPTSIHIPKPLLASVDRKARSLKSAAIDSLCKPSSASSTQPRTGRPSSSPVSSRWNPVEAAAEEMVLQNDRRQS